jgi:hypothetical protein
MEPSSTSEPPLWMSRSEYVSTLPLWRRLLAMLNWRPVYDIEQETRRLREETARIRESNARLLAVLQLSDSNWPTPPSADSN